ncbi:MAG: hypothetical protein HYX31_23755 [Mycobacterium sp.]|nr:hypothetical protein [Mycobacterium sp.]
MTSATAAGDYTFTGSVAARRPANAQATGTFAWDADVVGISTKHAGTSGSFTWTFIESIAENGVFLPPDDRWRISVQESRGTREIVTYDLNVTKLRITRALSGPFDLQCDVNPNDPSAAGIYFKPWRQLVHVEKIMQGKRRLWGTGIVQPSDIDENTGVLQLKAKGFSCYPKGIPWLEDLNWLANDVYRPVVEIWRHLQNDFPNGDLGVEIYPTTAGVEMLPGYAFDGDLLNLNFFATFVRQTDRLDCGDYIDALARDVPFDYVEQSAWNADRTDVVKKIKLGYPRLGVIQENLAFILNENVISAKPHTESQVDWVSDVGITGYFPGSEYCVVDDTEILTRDGWKRYDEIEPDSVTLTLNNETGLAEWQPVDAVNVFEGERWIYETEFRGHSSATTAEHRWPVSWFGDDGVSSRRRWSTTESLKRNEKITCAAPLVDIPATQKYDDALVELMAWYWTEGTWTEPGGKITISQWGPHMARIKAAAARLFGPELVGARRCCGVWRGSVWKSNAADNVITLGDAASAVLLEHIVDYRTKAVSYDFVANLTQAQLELFINCSVWADADSNWDPSREVQFGQKFEHNVDVLQFACQLAGRKTVKRVRSMNGQPWYMLGIYAQGRNLIKAHTMRENMQRRWHKGVVWCPTTENGSWCARRNGTVFFTGNSARLANADPDRLRRYLDEDTAFIDSNERSAAWANRRLARRQTPPYWETITILPNHPNAPLGSFDVGDSIIVKGSMPWVGEVAQFHKVIAITVDTEKGVVQLALKAEGAFNYDPIFFPSGVTNIIFNSAFDLNLNGWTPTGPGWAHDPAQGANRLGSVTIHADGAHHDLMTQPYGLAPFQIFPMGVSVKCANGVSAGAAIQLVAQFYDEDDNPMSAFLVGAVSGNGQIPWTRLAGNLLAPTGVASVAMRLHVDAAMTAGQVWFDDASIQI